MPITDPGRPNPDELLARVADADRKQQHGKLKIFFGAAPGVGKTYAMLQAARAQQAAGIDVVVGVVETHGRSETGALSEGFEVLPRRTMARGTVTLEEFDIDAALARRPELLLMDELAHTNAPGSRHVKRWQDVMELVEAGISVYSTLNVQHLDSLNDVVAQVTGVAVRETLPDSVLDRADAIELVDLPVDELLRRLTEGKVYIAGQAERARANFFRPGNLIALREMALRRTADRVDAQMRSYRRDHSITPTWPVTARLMVSIGPSPYSAKLIRAAKRMAERLQAEWIVAFVETPGFANASAEQRERVYSSLRLAEQLGAETITLSGHAVAESLLLYARSKNVSRIVIGKQGAPLWKRLLRGSVVDELIESSGDIEVCAISGEPGPPLAVAGDGAVRGQGAGWREDAVAAAVVAACTVVSVGLRGVLDPVNLVMFYLMGVVGIASRSSRRVSFLASAASVAAFDFFCVPPYFTFAVADYEYVVTFAVMLMVALMLSSLAARTRAQAQQAVVRESRVQALYRLTRELSNDLRSFDTARAAAAIAQEVSGYPVVIFLPEQNGSAEPRISFRSRTSDELSLPRSEEGVAQWVFSQGKRAGKGTDTLPGATAVYLPLRGAKQNMGVMAVEIGNTPGLGPEQMHLLEAFASQIGSSLERAQRAGEAESARVSAEAERTRSSLLSAVSHDLRTPLASITGAATTLLTHGDGLAAETRRELADSIAQEAHRLSRLVNNLLEITRLESGVVKIKPEWHSLEEIVGAALRDARSSLGNRVVQTDMPPDLPLIQADDVLLEQVFINLLENAAKYTPVDAAITIRASVRDLQLIVEVADSGPGFALGDEERIWDKFYRGPQGGSGNAAPGAGLGLTICRAIINAHGGTISASNRPGGGALIRITLPAATAPPKVDSDD